MNMSDTVKRWMDRSINGPVRTEADRVRNELDFAARMCELHPKSAAVWQKCIDRAGAVLEKAINTGAVESIRHAVRDAEKIMAPIGAAAKRYTVHCVGHAHIDMNWQWPWPETVGIVVDTFGTVLQLMDEYPEFCFSQSQASVYRIAEQFRPDILRKIRRRVKEGRWEVTASHWVECDKNIVSAESLCRQVLYTRRYMSELFGLRAGDVPIDWACDTFGHAITVPSYLRQAGVSYLYLHRPGTMTKPQPEVFWWEGPDKARVLVRNDSRFAYNGIIRHWMLSRFVEYVKETGLNDMMFVYGVGDHGGGPTRMDLDHAIEMNRWPIYPNIRFSTARRWFDTIAANAGSLPVWTRELNFEFLGCYTSQSLIKKGNRFCEARLGDAELASTLAWALAGGEYVSDGFRNAWTDVLFNQFHDILPGSGVAATRMHANALHQSSLAVAGQAMTGALRHLAAEVDTLAPGAGAGKPSRSVGCGSGLGTAHGDMSHGDQVAMRGARMFVVFNATAADRAEVVEATVWDGGEQSIANRAFHVTGPDGRTVRGQVTRSGIYWGHAFVDVAFPAKVPGLGCAVYRILEDDEAQGMKVDAVDPSVQAQHVGDTHYCGYCIPERGREHMENEFLSVTVDSRTGALTGVKDRKSGVELIGPRPAAGALEFEVERPHSMSSWQIDHAVGPAEAPQVMKVRRTDRGPFKVALEFSLKIRESTFTMTYGLFAGDPRLHIRVNGTWFQRGTPDTGVPVLNFVLPLTLRDAKARYEVPFGFIDRTQNRREEVPSLQWAQVSGRAGARQAGCLLLNDSKHGHSLEGSTLRLTLIRGSYDPDPLPEIGEHEIRMAVLPFAGTMPPADAIRHGNAFNHPLVATATDSHKGRLEAGRSWMRVGPRDVTLVSVKKAEDDDALILRLCNTSGRAVRARAQFDRGAMPRPVKAWAVDILEHPLPKPGWKASGDTVAGVIPARGIATVAVRFA
jgi:alpha-mannosidase